MPLIKGSSPSAFKTNTKEMMESGHPMKQSLAAAYSAKRMAKKKMAKGGEVKDKKDSPNWKAKGWTHDKDYNRGLHNDISGKGESYAGELVRKGFSDRAKEIHTEKLKSMSKMADPNIKGLHDGGEVGPAEEVLDQLRLSPKTQSYGHLPQPLEPDTGKHYYADEEDMPAHMMARGGMVQKIMAKRKLMMAQGGQVPEKLDYLNLDDSYPDPDLYETDMLDPHQPEFGADEVSKMKRKKMIGNIFSSMGDE